MVGTFFIYPSPRGGDFCPTFAHFIGAAGVSSEFFLSLLSENEH